MEIEESALLSCKEARRLGLSDNERACVVVWSCDMSLDCFVFLVSRSNQLFVENGQRKRIYKKSCKTGGERATEWENVPG